MSWRPGSEVRWIEVDDGIVVYDGATARFADLNEPAALLWLLLDEVDWSRGAAVDHLTDEVGLPADEAGRLVAGLLDELERSLAPGPG